MVLKKKKFRFEDARNQTRHDKTHFDWLVQHGLFVSLGDGFYELSDKGKAAADLGYYEFEPTATVTKQARRSRP